MNSAQCGQRDRPNTSFSSIFNIVRLGTCEAWSQPALPLLRSSVPVYPIVHQVTASLDQRWNVAVPILPTKDLSIVKQCKDRLKKAKSLRAARGARRKAVKKAEELLLRAEREQEDMTDMLDGERTELECILKKVRTGTTQPQFQRSEKRPETASSNTSPAAYL